MSRAQQHAPAGAGTKRSLEELYRPVFQDQNQQAPKGVGGHGPRRSPCAVLAL